MGGCGGESVGFSIFATLLLVGLLFYLMPALTAREKRAAAFPVVLALNILLGWTLIVWVALLIWALRMPEPPFREVS